MKIEKFIILLIFFLLSCKDSENCILNINGDFKNIEIYGVSDIYLKNDSFPEINILYDKEKFDVSYQIVDNNITIKVNKAFSLKPQTIKPVLNISFINLEKLVTHGPSNTKSIDTIKFQNNFTYYSIGEIGEANITLKCDHFEMANSANTLGHFYFKGDVNSIRFYNRYGCVIFADDLKCKYAEIFNESVGDVYVNPEIILNVYIWGTGNIYYFENPLMNIVEDRNKGGKVIKLY